MTEREWLEKTVRDIKAIDPAGVGFVDHDINREYAEFLTDFENRLASAEAREGFEG